MPISSYDRMEAAKAGLNPKVVAKQAQQAGIDPEDVIEQAGANAPQTIIPGKSPGGWKKSPKGLIREAKDEGGNTIYQPWVGVEGSSPSNPHPTTGTMPVKLNSRGRY